MWEKRRINFSVVAFSASSGGTFLHAADVDRRKQQVAQLAGELFRVLQDLLDLVGLLAHFFKRLARLVPVEADVSGLLLDLCRAHERRERARHVAHDLGLRAPGIFRPS